MWGEQSERAQAAWEDLKRAMWVERWALGIGMLLTVLAVEAVVILAELVRL